MVVTTRLLLKLPRVRCNDRVNLYLLVLTGMTATSLPSPSTFDYVILGNTSPVAAVMITDLLPTNCLPNCLGATQNMLPSDSDV